MKDLFFHYNPSIPFPIQADSYIRQQGDVVDVAMKYLKQKDAEAPEANEYNFICAYYDRVLTQAYGKEKDYNLYLLIRTFALDTQIDYNWLKYKQVYRFSSDLFNLLTEETDSESVMSDIFLYKLPFPCFFVENKVMIGGREYIGFYVLRRMSPEKDCEEELFIQFVQADKERSFLYVALPLRPGCAKKVSELLEERYNYIPFDPSDPHKREEFVEMGKKAVNVIAYLCTDKPDIVKIKSSSGNQNVNKKGKAPKKKDTVTIGQVGDKLARTIRESRVRYVYEGETTHEGRGKGTPKSAHIRKAHYHSYWTGKKDGSEERQLTVRLMSPIFVKGGNNQPTTIRKVSDQAKTKKNK